MSKPRGEHRPEYNHKLCRSAELMAAFVFGAMGLLAGYVIKSLVGCG